MHLVLVAPQPEKRGARVHQLLDRALPAVAADNGARPRTVACHFAAGPGDVGEGHGRRLSEELRHGLEPGHEPGGQVDTRDEDEPEMQDHRDIGAFHLVVRPLWLTEGDAVQLQK